MIILVNFYVVDSRILGSSLPIPDNAGEGRQMMEMVFQKFIDGNGDGNASLQELRMVCIFFQLLILEELQFNFKLINNKILFFTGRILSAPNCQPDTDWSY